MVSESVAASPIHARDLAARIDALPASAGLWRFIILLSLGGFFELYDLFQTGYISTGLIADGIFHTGAQGVFGVSDQAAFASATFLGLFVGASLLSPYADRFGRRATFMFALIWYGAFSLLLAFQQQAEWVIFLRFLVGVGLGIELVTIDTYLTEWVPAHLRTRAFAFAFFVQFLSVPAVALMSWWLVPQTIWGLSGWRYVVIAGALASLVIWLVRKGLPALLSGKGASVTHSLLYAFFITLAYPLGSLLCSFYADKMENKWQIVLSCLVTVIFGSLFALQNNPLWLILCGFFITWSNAWLTYSYHSYQSEIFPTHIRARAVGFCYSFSRLSTVFSSIIIGIILQYGGSLGVIAFIVASMLIVMLVIGLFGPKTRGIDLENI